MDKIVTGFAAFCWLVVASSALLRAQLIGTPEPEPETPKPRLAPLAPSATLPKPQQALSLAKPLIRIDQNFKGSYRDLINQDVEVIGYIRESATGEEQASIDPGDLGGFEITKLESKWFKKNVRIVGTISKGIDPLEEATRKIEKSTGHSLMMVYRDFYVLTIKTIELAERPGPAILNPLPMPRP